MMHDLLAQHNKKYSNLNIHKYMNELGLCSISRRRKPDYKWGKVNKVFPNLLNQNFGVASKNKIWCTDFTYLFLDNGTVRYNCTIINLVDCSTITSLNGNHITAELTIETLQLAISRHKPNKGLILHNDQGTHFTFRKFNYFCEKSYITIL